MLKDKAYNQELEFKIALDGPSAAGKGTIAKMLAEEFQLSYVQSSIFYRNLASLCIEQNISLDDTGKIMQLSSLDSVYGIRNQNISNEQIASVASTIAALPEVREVLSERLKEIFYTTRRIVMEGRDIGTVIAPNADLKIFITANLEQRALRRYNQLIAQGKDCILHDVLDQLKERDLRDTTRSSAPMVAAPEALIIETSSLNPGQVLQAIIKYIK